MTRTSPIAFCRRSVTTSTSAPYHGGSSAANVEAPRHASPPLDHAQAATATCPLTHVPACFALIPTAMGSGSCVGVRGAAGAGGRRRQYREERRHSAAKGSRQDKRRRIGTTPPPQNLPRSGIV